MCRPGRRAVPPADQTGSGNGHWARLRRAARPAFGDGGTALVLSDRGRASRALFEAIRVAGDHPLMRVKKGGHFRPAGRHRGWPMGRFAEAAGPAAGWRRAFANLTAVAL